ncbi:MAG: CotH kinase family protein [Gammaproteobacteria bacterium]|nr:CotH kinase family protein [Gammaproteobacteria bacterium]
MFAPGQALAQFGFGGNDRDIELVERFDADGDGYLDRAEREAARGFNSLRSPNRFTTGSERRGPTLSPDDVEIFGDEPLYDLGVLRTLFIEFEYPDWESELAAFHGTDVEVPATVTVDGKVYPNVGVHFRGNTSFRMVSAGRKRSLNLSFDHVDDDQRLLGYRTLNLLNGFGDPTFLRNVLYLQIANAYYPAPKANYVRVVINGEDWGLYVNVQQFNSDFTREAADSNETRWRIPGSFSSRGGLEYLGENFTAYRNTYSIKNKDRPESWDRLVELTRVLNRTPPDQLVEALEPLLDIDETLRFLAVDVALLNSDGYWSRNSDYSLYLDEDGRFHVTAYDANEALRESSGRGFGRFGGGSSGGDIDPLVAMQDPAKALSYRLLRVPELREQYLGYIRDIAENWLDWERLLPIAEQHRALIGDVVAADERKLFSTEAFDTGFDGGPQRGYSGAGSAPGSSLKSFVERRQAFLLNWLDANAGRIEL